MPLSEYEQRVIDDLERSLLRDDPKLAQAFRSSAPQSSGRIIGVAVGVMVGIAALILGWVWLQNSWMVIAGFAVIFGSLAWAAKGRKVHRKTEQEDDYSFLDIAPKEFANSNVSSTNGRFMDRLEDRWNRRQGEVR